MKSLPVCLQKVCKPRPPFTPKNLFPKIKKTLITTSLPQQVHTHIYLHKCFSVFTRTPRYSLLSLGCFCLFCCCLFVCFILVCSSILCFPNGESINYGFVENSGLSTEESQLRDRCIQQYDRATQSH